MSWSHLQQAPQLGQRPGLLQPRQAAQQFVDGGQARGGLDHAVFQQCHEPARLDADAADLLTCLVLDDGVADLLVQNQQLEDARTPPVARVLALGASLAPLELRADDVGVAVPEALQTRGVGR